MSYLKAQLGGGTLGWLAPFAGMNKALGGLLGVFIALGLTSWLTTCRLVGGQVLSLREREYVEAARALGAGSGHVIRAHLLPNTLGPILVAATLGVPNAILLEASLSFIGLGVDPPMPSWGLMISEGVQAVQSYPHVILAPAIAVSLTLLAFNFLGDGLRGALDPLLKRAYHDAASPAGNAAGCPPQDRSGNSRACTHGVRRSNRHRRQRRTGPRPGPLRPRHSGPVICGRAALRADGAQLHRRVLGPGGPAEL